MILAQQAESVAGDSPRTGDMMTSVIFREKGDGKIISKVEVRVAGEVYFSGPDGKAEFPLPAASGETELEIYRSGYVPMTLTVSELREQQGQDIFLYPDVAQNQVIIRGKRQRSVSKKQISIEEVREVTPRGDPAQITKLLPGVQTQGFRPEVVIRGSGPNDSRYYVDGISIPFIFHSIGGISVLPKSLIDQVSFQSGGFLPSWGNATGGVIVLETSKEIPERPKSEFTLNLPMFAGAYHERPLSDHEVVSASVRRSFLEYIVPQFSKENLIIPAFYDAHLRYVNQSEQGSTKVIALSSLDTLKLEVGGFEGADESGKGRFKISTYFGAMGVEQQTRLGDGWSYVVTPQILYSHINNDFQDNFVRIKAWSFRTPLEFQKRLGRKQKWRFGIEGEIVKAKVHVLAPRISEDDPFLDFEDAPVAESEVNETGRAGAAWSSIDVKLGDFILTPGLRAFQSTQVGSPGVDPRFIATWDMTKESVFKLAVGRYSKAPQEYESDADFGNDDLTWEQSMHYILGLAHQWSDSWNSEFQLYYKSNRQMVQSDPVERYINSGQLRSRGAEIFVRKNLTDRWFGWLAYTYSVTEEKKNAEQDWKPSQYDQTHVINLVSAYKLSGQWTLGGRFNYHTGDRYTPVDGAVYHAGLNKYQPIYSDDKLYQARLPTWHQADIYTSVEQLYDYFKIKYRFGIEFLSATRQAFGVTYNYDYSKKDYFKGVPPIPYFEVTGEF